MPTRTGPPWRKAPTWALGALASGDVGYPATRVYLALLEAAQLNAPRSVDSTERRIAASIDMDAALVHRAVTKLRDAGLITTRRGLNQHRATTFELIEHSPAAVTTSAAEGGDSVPTKSAATPAQKSAAKSAAHPLSPAETHPLDLREVEDPASQGSSTESFYRSVRTGLRPGARAPEVGEQIAALEGELVVEGILGAGEHLSDKVRAEMASVDAETLEGIIVCATESRLRPLVPAILKRIREYHLPVPFDESAEDADEVMAR